MSIEAKIFYSVNIPESAQYADKIMEKFSNLDCNFHISTCSIETSNSLWSLLGLRSVPICIVFNKNHPQAMQVGYLNTEEICNLVNNIDPACETPEIDVNKIWTFPSKEKTINYSVINSSGCHRYGRWNEQSLSAPSIQTGWCAPSRRKKINEFLHLKLDCLAHIETIYLYPRIRRDGVASFKSFPKQIRIMFRETGMEWETPVEINKETKQDSRTEIIPIRSQNACNEIIIEILESHSISGKNFPSLAGILIEGTCSENSNKMSLIKEQILDVYDPEYPKKLGVSYNKDFSVSNYSLSLNQTTAQCFTPHPLTLCATKGKLQVYHNNQEMIILSAGDIINIQPETLFHLSGIESENRYILVSPADDRKFIWGAR